MDTLVWCQLKGRSGPKNVPDNNGSGPVIKDSLKSYKMQPSLANS